MSGKEVGADILAAVASRTEQNNKRRMIDLQELLRSTRFSKQEIMMMYRGFKQVIDEPVEIFHNFYLILGVSKWFC